MRNALLLHGTNGNSKVNWFPWLKKRLESKGWKVWVPDLPQAETPNIKRYNKHIFSNKVFVFNADTVIVGHSSGSVAALGLLQELPDNEIVKKVVLVGSFKDNLGWDNLDGLFEEPFDFKKIKKSAKHFIYIHSDNDPYCPLEHAKYLSKNTDGKLVLVKGEKHFSTDAGGEKYKQFPLILEYLDT